MLNFNDWCIYVITHKYIDCMPSLSNVYKWLYVGAYKQNERKEEYLYDNDGINISQKNANYCELTGMYWIWKNTSSQIKGLVHYRRFFTKNDLTENEKYFYKALDYLKILKKYDCIVASRLYVAQKDIEEHYKKYHYESDYIALKDVIKELFPDYLHAFEEAFSCNYFFPCNMIVARGNTFDNYCDWLFKVLGELENRVDISSYDVQQARIYGFISERLLHVWLIKNNVSYIEAPMVQVGSRLRYKIRLYLDKVLKKAIREN